MTTNQGSLSYFFAHYKFLSALKKQVNIKEIIGILSQKQSKWHNSNEMMLIFGLDEEEMFPKMRCQLSKFKKK